MSNKKTPQSKNRRSRLNQNAPDINFSPQNNFELTGITPPPQQHSEIRFRPQSFDYETRLPQPNPRENLFSVHRPFIPPQRAHQEPSGSSYRPNMDFLHSSQPYQEYSPIRSTNLDMHLESLDDWAEYPTEGYEYPSQEYPTQDVSMGQGSGHGSYHGSFHGSMAVGDDDDDVVEETSPIKAKKASRRATKAKAKGKEPEPFKKAEAWSTYEEVVLCKAFIFVSENNKKGNNMNRHKFWEKVVAYFQKETGSQRTYNSIMSKWKTRIRGPVSNFGAIMDNVHKHHGSGENDVDDMSKALIEYRARHGHEFHMVECWKVLRGHDAWKDEQPIFASGSRKKVKGSSTTSGSTKAPSFQDLDEDDDEDDDDTEEGSRESRPQGRDAARKKKSSTSSSCEPPKGFLSGLASDFWSAKPSKKDKAKEREDSWRQYKERELAIKEQKLAYQKRLVEIQSNQEELMKTTKREQDLIFYNSEINPNLSQEGKEELMRIKAEIKARYKLNY